MDSLQKMCNFLTFKNKVVKYSAHQFMADSPPPGTVTDRNDPHRLIWREQFSTGDQSKESRVSFFNSGFAACVKCGQGDVWRFEETAGVRENGDMYGTAIFRCQNKQCKWKTSFMFDDGARQCTHFEADSWPRGIHFYPVHFMELWCDRHNLPELKKLFKEQAINGDMLLALQEAGQIKLKLNMDESTYKKVKVALTQVDSALLPRKTTSWSDRRKVKRAKEKERQRKAMKRVTVQSEEKQSNSHSRALFVKERGNRR